MWKLLAVLGVGTLGLAILKIKNPECFHDMKETLDDISNKASEKMKNMME